MKNGKDQELFPSFRPRIDPLRQRFLGKPFPGHAIHFLLMLIRSEHICLLLSTHSGVSCKRILAPRSHDC